MLKKEELENGLTNEYLEVMKEEDILWVESVCEKLKRKMEWVSEKSKEKIPYTTVNGVHDDRGDEKIKFSKDDGINWWCNGFWGGMLWLMYYETKEERYAEIARISEQKLDRALENYHGLHHDVGFMYLPTAVTNYKLTGNADAKKRGMHAANLLAGRFIPAGKFIRAWNDIPNSESDTRGWAIIDCMFNIPLLYWASEESNDPRFRQIAMMHADTVMEHFIRPDGSVKHIVEFDPYTGAYLKDYGGQGYEQGSSWTRGQTWGLYGFLMSYRHTGKQEYLDTAKKIAHYFMANIPEDGLIPIDFRQPEIPLWYDDTAAAIAACGLIEISKVVNKLEKKLYLESAIKLLKALDQNHCNYGEEDDCILQKCSASYHNEEHEVTIIYGDYYFIEAMFKLKGNDLFIW